MTFSFKAVSGWIAARRVARARRLALVTLMEMSEARLVDLGIERQDVLLAIENARSENGARRFVGASLIAPFGKVLAIVRTSY